MDFSFIQITDHHLPETEDTLVKGFSPFFAFRKVMRHIAEQNAERADFIVSTGDLVQPPTDKAYQAFTKLIGYNGDATQIPGPMKITLEGLTNKPFYCLPGNHDDRQNFYANLFPIQTPLYKMNTRFIHKNVQFIFLDWGPGVKGTIHQDTLEFLHNALQTDLPSILLMHYQIVPLGTRWADNLLPDDVSKFWDSVAEKNVIGILSGHTHATFDQVKENIPVLGLRSTTYSLGLFDEPVYSLTPPHYRLVSVRDGVLTSRIFEVPL